MQVLIAVGHRDFMVLLTFYISRSRLGRACRACAEDREMANLLGIDTGPGDFPDVRAGRGAGRGSRRAGGLLYGLVITISVFSPA